MKKDNEKIWLSEYYAPFLVPSNYCVFCEKCTDIFWDYSNGPYMCMCDDQHQYEDGCEYFVEDKSIESPDYDIQDNKVIVFFSEEQKRQIDILNRIEKKFFSIAEELFNKGKEQEDKNE